MTEQLVTKNQETSSKKKKSLLSKLVIFLMLILLSYFGLKYWKISSERKVNAASEVEKFDNVESEIFDLSDEYKNQKAKPLHDNSEIIPELTFNELKEKDAEFIYKMILKNQIQLGELRSQMEVLRSEIIKYENREKIGRIIFSYSDLRQNIFAGKSYAEELRNFELLTSFDENLQSKISKLKPFLSSFSDHQTLSKTFNDLIPSLIFTKNNLTPDTGIISKIRRNISRLITIRKIDGGDASDVDAVIVKIEKALREENYQEALNYGLSLDQNYHKILKGFLDSLSLSIEVRKIDQEILNYLKILS